MLRRTSALLAVAAVWLLHAQGADALVHLDKGRITINGVQLLQDYYDEKRFFYVPQFPRLAQKRDGTFELLCLKYVGKGGKNNGGLLHALVEFTLPPDLLEEVQKELAAKVPGAMLVGPVELLEAIEEGEEAMGSFQVVSAVLSSTGEGGLTRNMITSGHAPFTPGSKAVVAAILTQEGSSLLWDSFTGPTSDVSVSVSGYYHAAVQAYNAKIEAEMEVIYKHFSKIDNRQKGYTRNQLRKVVDDLQRNGVLKITEMDSGKAYGVDNKDMQGILQLVTDKLTELMFDAETGWSKEPEREKAVEAEQIQGRQERGWFSKTFGGTEDTKYYTDNQHVLKKREDVRRSKFTLQLDKTTTIKVPVNTSGNLGGIYDAMGEDARYFRIVNLDDPSFEVRRIHFQVDGGFVDSFQDTVNFVTVNFRKNYDGTAPNTQALQFTHADVKEGKTVQEASFPRLGSTDPNWIEYEYQVRWSLRDGPTVSIPAKADKWIKSTDAAVSLTPPFTKRLIEIDADRELFRQRNVSTGILEFATVLGGQPKLQKKATLRAADAESAGTVSVYVDREEPVAYRVSWYAPGRQDRGALRLLDSDYLFIEPPMLEPANAPAAKPETPAEAPQPPAAEPENTTAEEGG